MIITPSLDLVVVVVGINNPVDPVKLDNYCMHILTLRPASENPMLHTVTIKIITLQILLIKI